MRVVIIFDMPNTKSSDIRYKVLDRCLRQGGYSTSELMNEVNKELELQGFPTVSALNTIRQDMDHIGSSYPDICIVDKKIGRNVTYSYENPESSIFRLPFNDDELAQLSQCMAILSRFEGTPQMEWMHSFIERFKLSLNIDVDGKQVVGFDECKYLRGKEYFATLLSAICNKRVLAIGYKSFQRGAVKEVLLHPYYIKEYNNRWFLLGREQIQQNYNEEHGITPTTIKKAVRERISITKEAVATVNKLEKDPESMSRAEIEKLIQKVTKEMQKAAAELNFEAAAELRDQMVELKSRLRDD